MRVLGIRIDLMNSLQSIVSGTRIELVQTLCIGRSLCTNTKPLFIHIILTFYIIENITSVHPRSVGIMNIQIFGLCILPPTITKLKSKTANTVSSLSHTSSILVYFFPIADQYVGLRLLVFRIGRCIESIATKLSQHYRLSTFFFHSIIQIGE